MNRVPCLVRLRQPLFVVVEELFFDLVLHVGKTATIIAPLKTTIQKNAGNPI